MITFKRFRVSIVIVAVAFTMLGASLLGIVLARTSTQKMDSVANRMWTTLENGVDNWVDGEGYVANLASKTDHTNKTTGTTDFTNNRDNSDSHAAVIARWHRDYLRYISRRCA
jgi:hypothetical protein